MNSIIETAGLRVDSGDIGQVLAHGRHLVETGQHEAAANLYAAALSGPTMGAADPAHAEMEHNLAAALCLLADAPRPRDDAVLLLDDALALLDRALTIRTRHAMPAAWATSRANLALVHIKLYALTAAKGHVMAAHIALDGTEEALYEAAEYEAIDWVRSIREYLAAIDQRERRLRE